MWGEADPVGLWGEASSDQLVAEFAGILTLANEKTPGQWAGGFFR
jgi:hypothetical protein